jgi:hypothetical protein
MKELAKERIDIVDPDEGDRMEDCRRDGTSEEGID